MIDGRDTSAPASEGSTDRGPTRANQRASDTACGLATGDFRVPAGLARRIEVSERLFRQKSRKRENATEQSVARAVSVPLCGPSRSAPNLQTRSRRLREPQPSRRPAW